MSTHAETDHADHIHAKHETHIQEVKIRLVVIS